MPSLSKNNDKTLNGSHVLITGATGFIGSHLARKLLDANCKVSVFIRPSSDLWRIQDIIDQLDVHHGDLNRFDPNELQSKLSGVRILYHLGAHGVNPSVRDIPTMMETNIQGTLRLLRLARDLKIDRFVYCGSCSEYGSGNSLSESDALKPIDEYGISKSSAWILVNMFYHKHGLPVVSLRPFTPYGPFELAYRLVPHTILSVLNKEDIKLTGGKQTRDFIFIEDVVGAFLMAGIKEEIIGDTFNVCSGKAVSIKEVVLTITQLMNSPVKPLFGAQPYRESELWTSSGNPSHAERKLSWTAKTSLEHGLTKTIAWFKKNLKRYTAYSCG